MSLWVLLLMFLALTLPLASVLLLLVPETGTETETGRCGIISGIGGIQDTFLFFWLAVVDLLANLLKIFWLLHFITAYPSEDTVEGCQHEGCHNS